MPKQGMELRVYLRLKRPSVFKNSCKDVDFGSQDSSSCGSKVRPSDFDLGVVALAFDLGFGVLGLGFLAVFSEGNTIKTAQKVLNSKVWMSY